MASPLLRKADHNYHVQDIHDLSVTTVTNIKITEYVNIKPTVIHLIWLLLLGLHNGRMSYILTILESPQ